MHSYLRDTTLGKGCQNVWAATSFVDTELGVTSRKGPLRTLSPIRVETIDDGRI